MIKQVLGWTTPKPRDPEAADRWTWIVIAAQTQLRLARPLDTDLRRSWERPLPSNKLTPVRVRRGFRNLCTVTPTPAQVQKPTKPGPGRPRLQEPAARPRGRVLATGEPYVRPAHHRTGTKPRRTGGKPEAPTVSAAPCQ